MLLHGFTGTPASWDAVRALLPRRLVDVPPLFGHHPELLSPPAAPFADGSAFLAEVDRLAARAASLGPRIHLAGYSMGARLALALAARHPSRIARLTLIGVQAGLTEPGERAARVAADEAWAHLAEDRGIEPFVTAWEAQLLFATQARLDEATRAKLSARRRAHHPSGLAAALRALGLGRMPDLHPALARLTVPVRLLAGEQDAKFRTIACELAALLPRAAVTTVAGAGHDLTLEAPRAVARALMEGETS